MKKALLGMALAVGLTCSSCLGPNKAFNGLHDWNEEVSEADWINELVFLGLNIVPVYALFYVADILVLNTIDYWGGDD